MIRFLKISAPYPDFLAHAYAEEPGLAAQPYVAQLQRLMEWRFAYSDFWHRHLTATGLFEAAECIGNAVPLQRQWAAEHGLPYDPSTREGCQAVLAAQVGEYRPEILFLHGGQYTTPSFRRQLREQVPSIRMIVGYDGVAENSAERFAGCDVVLACLETSVAYYRGAGFHSRLIKNAFEASMTSVAAGVARDLPVSFVGGVQFGHRQHARRARILAQISRHSDPALFLQLPDVEEYARTVAREVRYKRNLWAPIQAVRQWPDFRRLARLNRGMLCGVEMYRTLAQSQITLNIHIDAAGAAAANVRLFEATGMGACLVTDWKPNIGRLFEEDREIVAFRSAEECVEKVRYLLDHPIERAAIAARGQQRTLHDHQLDEELRALAGWITCIK